MAKVLVLLTFIPAETDEICDLSLVEYYEDEYVTLSDELWWPSSAASNKPR